MENLDSVIEVAKTLKSTTVYTVSSEEVWTPKEKERKLKPQKGFIKRVGRNGMYLADIIVSINFNMEVRLERFLVDGGLKMGLGNRS